MLLKLPKCGDTRCLVLTDPATPVGPQSVNSFSYWILQFMNRRWLFYRSDKCDRIGDYIYPYTNNCFLIDFHNCFGSTTTTTQEATHTCELNKLL